MGGSTKRRIAGLAITGLVIGGVVGVTSMSASGQTPTPGTVLTVPYGTLTIELSDAGAYYSLLRYGASTPEQELIKFGQPCATIEPGSGDLLVLSPTPGSATTDTVQIRNNAFGVNTAGTSCGSSSAAVISGNERLKISFGPDLSGVFAKSADLVLTQVKRGNLKYALGTGALSSPITISQSPQTVNVDPVISSTGDLFTSITIASTSTRDNEGLSVANGTSFELVTRDPDFGFGVNCNQFVTDTGGSADAASSATFERLNNKTGTTAECQAVGVNVDIQAARVYWNNAFTALNSTTTAQTVQAYFSIVWTATSDLGALNRLIDYDAEGAQLETAMQWCAGVSNGIPILPNSPTGFGINVGTTTNPVWKAPWCLVKDDRVLAGDGKIVQTQKLFGSGDPWAR